MMSAVEQRAERARSRSARTGRRCGEPKAATSGRSAGRAASGPSDISERAASRADADDADADADDAGRSASVSTPISFATNVSTIDTNTCPSKKKNNSLLCFLNNGSNSMDLFSISTKENQFGSRMVVFQNCDGRAVVTTSKKVDDMEKKQNEMNFVLRHNYVFISIQRILSVWLFKNSL